MAKRKKSRKNPVMMSPRLQEHVEDFIVKAERLGETAEKLASHFERNRIGRLLQGFANSIEKFTEEIADEAMYER